jgi:hypothetical protein
LCANTIARRNGREARGGTSRRSRRRDLRIVFNRIEELKRNAGALSGLEPLEA